MWCLLLSCRSRSRSRGCCGVWWPKLLPECTASALLAAAPPLSLTERCRPCRLWLPLLPLLLWTPPGLKEPECPPRGWNLSLQSPSNELLCPPLADSLPPGAPFPARVLLPLVWKCPQAAWPARSRSLSLSAPRGRLLLKLLLPPLALVLGMPAGAADRLLGRREGSAVGRVLLLALLRLLCHESRGAPMGNAGA